MLLQQTIPRNECCLQYSFSVCALFALDHPSLKFLDDRKSKFLFRALHEQLDIEEFASLCPPGRARRGVGSKRECIVQRRYALPSSRRPAHTYTHTRVHRVTTRRPLRRRLGASARTRCNFSHRREKPPSLLEHTNKVNFRFTTHAPSVQCVSLVSALHVVPLIRDLKAMWGLSISQR